MSYGAFFVSYPDAWGWIYTTRCKWPNSDFLFSFTQMCKQGKERTISDVVRSKTGLYPHAEINCIWFRYLPCSKQTGRIFPVIVCRASVKMQIAAAYPKVLIRLRFFHLCLKNAGCFILLRSSRALQNVRRTHSRCSITTWLYLIFSGTLQSAAFIHSDVSPEQSEIRTTIPHE